MYGQDKAILAIREAYHISNNDDYYLYQGNATSFLRKPAKNVD